MNVYLKYISIFCFSLILLPGIAAAQVRVVAQVDNNKDIYINSDFTFYVIIDGINKPGEVDTTPLAEFHPGPPAGQDISQSSISIINGRTTQNVTKRYVTSYTLNCSQAGVKQIPSLTVTVDGKTYRTNPVQINVLKPGTTDKLELDVDLSEKQCYVGQPVIMTVKFYVMASVGDFNFNIPAFNTNDFYLEDPDIINPQAKQFQLGDGVIVLISQDRITHNGRDAILVSFSKVLIPKRAGLIDLGSAAVSANVAIGRTADPMDSFFGGSFFGSSVQYKRFMVNSQPEQLNILNLPLQGKPDGFYGLVGKYSIACSASPTKVNVGDPITLDIKIGGNKYLKPVQWPALDKIPDFDKNFKVPSERASPVIRDGYKVFTQTIRANSDKITEIPPIPLAYFDSEKGTYVTAKTEPIKLEVSPTKILTGSDLQGSDSSPVNKEVEAIKQGLSANYHDVGALQNQDFSPLAAIVSPTYLVIWGSPLAILLFSAFTKVYNSTTPEKEAQKRRRSASHKAISDLKNMLSSDSPEKIETLAAILKQYIGDRFDKTAGSLTSDDCCEVITKEAGDSQAAEKYKEIIADCEAARYASANTNVSSGQVEDAIDLILTIEKKSGK